MKKIIKNEQTFEEKLEDFGTKMLVRRYKLDHRPINSVSDVFFYILEYNTEYEHYMHDMKHSRCNVPDEAHFIFNLPFVDAFKFTVLLHQEFGFFYYPGINGNSTFYDSRYYELKKQFICNKYHIPYVKPETKVNYILYSVFPNKKVQDICYGISQSSNDGDAVGLNDNSINKLDNYFDDPTRFFTFDDDYSRTKSNN